jgi:dihydroorotase
MSQSTIIKNISIVNENTITIADIYIKDGYIQKIGTCDIPDAQIIDGTGKYVLPGIIDGQVHFREPGLTHKADLHSESKAAVAGGVTSFIDMPNTVPNVLNMAILNEKYKLAAEKSLANFGFFLGVNGDNLDEVIKTDTSELLAVSDDGLYFTKKGNLLADNPETMEKLFANCKSLIAIHSEKEAIIEANEEAYRKQYGDDVPVACHPLIRSEQACYEATERAIALAQKHNARLHILHLSTAAETKLFRNDIPLSEKKITTEVSVHHLWFTDKDYSRLGTLIKWNPAIKTEQDAKGLLQALIDDHIDIVTTDHAPHTLEEKRKPYFQSMSGAPIVQFSLNIMIDFYQRGLISFNKLVEKMCHNPAVLYGMNKRGFIRQGYFADLVIVDLNGQTEVTKDTVLSKCGWSPLEGTTFKSKITHTFVNGHLVYHNGKFDESVKGQALKRYKV